MHGTDFTWRQADFTAHRAPYEGENQAGYYASNVGKSNERLMAIDESFMDLTDRITQVESEASRPDEIVKGKDDDNDETGNWCKQMDESK